MPRTIGDHDWLYRKLDWPERKRHWDPVDDAIHPEAFEEGGPHLSIGLAS